MNYNIKAGKNKSNTTELFLPSLKSNIKNDPVFFNVWLYYLSIQNTNFISNTKAFYDDLKKKMNKNERTLEEICQKSIERINRNNLERFPNTSIIDTEDQF